MSVRSGFVYDRMTKEHSLPHISFSPGCDMPQPATEMTYWNPRLWVDKFCFAHRQWVWVTGLSDPFRYPVDEMKEPRTTSLSSLNLLFHAGDNVGCPFSLDSKGSDGLDAICIWRCSLRVVQHIMRANKVHQLLVCGNVWTSKQLRHALKVSVTRHWWKRDIMHSATATTSSWNTQMSKCEIYAWWREWRVCGNEQKIVKKTRPHVSCSRAGE